MKEEQNENIENQSSNEDLKENNETAQNKGMDTEQNHCEEDCHCDCDCHEGCECGETCDCDENCECGCQQGQECHCHDENCKEHGGLNDKEHHHGHEHKHEHCDCHQNHDAELASQYLQMAQRLQADFDNYRKRVAEQLDFQREEGKRSVIEVFLPCLDTFKEAKKNIDDEKVLAGVNMIEDKILKALASLNVEKIDAVGQKFDHNLHEVIAVFSDSTKENDIILEEFQAGYKLNGKVIRYSKVVVNKLS